MKASDMLDLLHVYLEDDLIAGAGNIHVQHAVRSHLYKNLYDVDYAGPKPPDEDDTDNPDYETSRNAEGLYVGDIDEEDLDRPVDPRSRKAPSAATKPYIPPTDFDHDADDPFGAALSPEAVRALRNR